MSIAFGPIPSRRLGFSLGINNIPPKFCSYSCVYCQLGRTKDYLIERRPFYEPDRIRDEVTTHLEAIVGRGQQVDHLSFVPEGEPTLDAHLGEAIQALKPLKVPVAVISNASLIWKDDVRRDLALADWVSLKVASVDELIWRRIDRPHGALELKRILESIKTFAAGFTGTLTTETMLLPGINDSEETLLNLARFLAEIQPATAYVLVPTRPPAEQWIKPPSEEIVNRAVQIFSDHLDNVEYLIGYEREEFESTGDVADDILRIAAVHPMREESMMNLIDSNGGDRTILEDLLARELLVKTVYADTVFYVRRVRLKTE